MIYTDATIEGLAHLRTYAAKYPTMALSEAINALDNAGVFAALDEQTDYASAEDILAESAALHGVTREQIQDVNRGSVYGLAEEEGRRAGFGAALPRPVDPDELEDTSGDDLAKAFDRLAMLAYPKACRCGGSFNGSVGGSGCTC